MADTRPDAWKRIHPDPCNANVARRNEAATRDAFDQIVNYITNQENFESAGGDLVFFVIQEDAFGEESVTVHALDNETYEDSEVEWELYDYTPDGRFSVNFFAGHYGVGRKTPEKGENILTAVEVEGFARYINGKLNEDMGATTANKAEVTVDDYWGGYPNSHDPGGTLVIHDRNGFIADAEKDDRFIAVYDEKEREYVPFATPAGQGEVIFFQITAIEGPDDKSVLVEGIDASVNETTGEVTYSKNGKEYIAYDYSDHERFVKNFVVDYYGVGRLTTKIAPNALTIIELEGKARYVTGTLQADVSGPTVAGDVEEFWGAYPNIQDPGPFVTLHDRMGFAQNAKSGDEFLAIWDEQLQQYVLITSPEACECGFTGEVEFAAICELEANDCCLWPGVVRRLDEDATDSFCSPVWCMVPVWLMCFDQVAEYDSDGEVGADWPLVDDWCGIAKLVKRDHDCNGDIRHVYGVDCGDCPCFCPDFEYEGTLRQRDCMTDDVVFTMKCVTQNPVEPSAPHSPPANPVTGLKAFWGEFEVEGEYPLVGYRLNLTSDISVDFPAVPEQLLDAETLNVSEVYAISGCNGVGAASSKTAMCGITRVFANRDAANGGSDGQWHEITGQSFTWDGNQEPDGPYILRDTSGDMLTCSRTFKYGVYVTCQSGSKGSSTGIVGRAIYHLWPEGDITRVADTCMGVLVPSSGQYFVNEQSNATNTSSGCCQYYDETSFDPQFGETWGSPLCSATVPGDTSGSFLLHNPILKHTLPSCADIIDGSYEGVGPYAAGAPDTVIEHDWSGAEDCKDKGQGQ